MNVGGNRLDSGVKFCLDDTWYEKLVALMYSLELWYSRCHLWRWSASNVLSTLGACGNSASINYSSGKRLIFKLGGTEKKMINQKLVT